jgi:hypothetical protein
MTRNGPAVSVYRAFLRMYPRHFRHEYGADMVTLFGEQLGDETTARVWARAAVDLALTVPARHLEARMNRPPNRLVSLLFASVALGSLLFAVVVGSNPGMVAIAVLVTVIAAGLAVLDRRRNAPIVRPAPDRWWKLLTAGAALLATMVVVTTITGEVPSVLWPPTMIAFASAFVMLLAGAILGVARLAGPRSPA